MRSRLCSSAEDSTPLKPKPITSIEDSNRHTNIKDKNKHYNDNPNNDIQKPSKNKKKKNKSKNKISDTPTSTFENLDVDPRHDPSLYNLDISHLCPSNFHTTEPRSLAPTMSRQQMILARRLPLFNFPSSLYVLADFKHQPNPSLASLTLPTDLGPSPYDPPPEVVVPCPEEVGSGSDSLTSRVLNLDGMFPAMGT